ncbi:Ger(x)C family germination protein [Paenibacillus shirakamiensis]|uniref:Ger(X)C family germination protein n=1 Tax=Paenibacillus shirakamiensis TaxID=1265935 RepID=A0ABS4JG81_9BACL|nr:Ger(x)C family spore germination protein [Paenibacillus shirakamiensis]MBP2000720.1 Ger(x)C family germination protein [Paenibacillus shirakamiensis]
MKPTFRIVLILVVVVLMLPIQACKFKDIDLKLFVIAMGIDVSEKSPDKLSVTLKIAIPQGDPKTSDEKVEILTQEAVSIAEAIREAKSRVDKEIDFGHCKAILFGEAYARKDLRGGTDWALRRRDIQLLNFIGIAKPSAKEVLTVQPPTERIPANSILLALSKDGTESPFIVNIYLYNLYRRLQEKGWDPVLPVIEFQTDDEFLINKIYLLDKKKIQVLLTPEETRLFNLLTTKDLKTNFSFRYQGDKMDYNVEHSKSNYKIQSNVKDKSSIDYKINITAELEENQQELPMNKTTLEKISVAASEEMNQQVEALLKKIQKSHLDPIGWGLRYEATHWNNSTEMKEWTEMYPKLDFKVHASIKIHYSGMLN